MWGWFSKKNTTKRIHLDYASTTPVHPEVESAMHPYWNEQWANASAIYKEGVEVRKVIESNRTELARVLHVRPLDITFTSGGTESNNLALIGLVDALHRDGRRYEDMEIISPRIEHPSILETLSYLDRRGVVVKYVSVTEEGEIVISELETLLSGKTILVTCAYVNSEVGVVQDIKKISRTVRLHNETSGSHTLVHVDASQAPLWLPCDLDRLGVDMMTLDAGKCYGPKSVGVLAHRHWVTLSSLMHGGGQESGLRSGTENTALIVGCVRALVRAQAGYETRAVVVSKSRDEFFELITKEIPLAIVNGSRDSRVANNVNISIPNLDTEYAVIWLDAKGVCASTKSACGAKETTGSSVVREMTKDESRALSTIRFTLGEETKNSDIEVAVRILKEFVEQMQSKRE